MLGSPSFQPTMPETESRIFQKLTDPKQYPGHHKHRFDKKTGQGRGLDGRDSVQKGTGANGVRATHVGKIERVNMTHDAVTEINKDVDAGVLKVTADGRNYELDKDSIFSKLTDPKLYPGHHKHRFDKKTGKGKGLAGRESLRKGGTTSTHSHVYQPDQAVIDVGADLMRKKNSDRADRPTGPRQRKDSPRGRPGGTTPRSGANTPRSTGAGSPSRSLSGEAEAEDGAGSPEPEDMLMSAQAAGRGHAGMLDEEQPTIFQKLTDPKLYVGHHKHRFDKKGKGKGLAGRDSVRKGGSVQTHRHVYQDDAPVGEIYEMMRQKGSEKADRPIAHRKVLKGSGKPDQSPRGENDAEPEPEPEQPSIYDKLTDPSQYTGAHKKRFDRHGKGLGKSGREEPEDEIRRTFAIDGLVNQTSISPLLLGLQGDISERSLVDAAEHVADGWRAELRGSSSVAYKAEAEQERQGDCVRPPADEQEVGEERGCLAAAAADGTGGWLAERA